MNHVSCPLCHAFAFRPTAHPDYQQCQSCGVVFQSTNIEPVADYFSSQNMVPNCTRQIGSYRQYLSCIDRYCAGFQPKVLVDIGAADGFFLKTARNHFQGMAIYACEESLVARRALIDAGIPIVELEGIKTLAGPKLVVMLQVLEHLANPVDFLKACALAPRDWLVVTSPAIDTVYYERNGKNWQSFSPSHHLILYGRKSLEVLLAKCGYEIVAYEHCYSGSVARNVPTALLMYFYRIMLWGRNALRGTVAAFPRYYGKHSFILVARKR